MKYNFNHFYSKRGANWKSDLKWSLCPSSPFLPLSFCLPPSAVASPVCCGVKRKAGWALPPVRQTEQSNCGCVWGAKANISPRASQSCCVWRFEVLSGISLREVQQTWAESFSSLDSCEWNWLEKQTHWYATTTGSICSHGNSFASFLEAFQCVTRFLYLLMIIYYQAAAPVSLHPGRRCVL